MKHSDEELDRILDDTLEGIRDERPDAAAAACENAWRRITDSAEYRDAARPSTGPERIRSCADFQALIPGFVAGTLAAPRRLLVQDHVGECVSCRRLLNELRAAGRGKAAVGEIAGRRGSGRIARLGWRLAAAAVLFVALIGISIRTDAFSFETGGIIHVEAVDGELFRVTEDGAVPVAAGSVLQLGRNDAIRTAKGSSAVLRLADDSAVEMRERSELAVRERRHLLPGRRDDGVIGLDRGSIIVQAADQGSGHLFVDTRACHVAVKGTVFAVNHGVKGSRVSVLEGEVQVDHSGSRDVLLPGQQTTTSAALERVPLDQEIAWSRNRDQYVALLHEINALSREIDELLRPELRFETDLLDMAPADTAIYVAMPNVGNGLGDALDLVRDRLSSSPLLGAWWEETFHASQDLAEVERLFERVRTYSDQLGPEIVLTLPLVEGDLDDPLFLAGVEGHDAIVSLLDEEIARVADQAPDVRLQVFDGALPAAPTRDERGRGALMYFWVRDDLLAVSPSFERLQHLDAVLTGAFARMSGGAFHERLAARYADGVEWLVGIDLETLLARQRDEDGALEQSGLGDVQHLILERRQDGARTENRAELIFAQPRRRMAAWLAEPAPLGALDYVGPDANFASGLVMKDMGTLVDELFAMIGSFDDDFEAELAEFQSEHGIDIRRDVAAPLGGEFALALDGPVLPVPSWLLVVEVYDPTRLQQTIEDLVGRINDEVELAGGVPSLKLVPRSIAGREGHSIELAGGALTVHYVFDEGYLVAGASPAVVDHALRVRATGVGLTESPAFLDLLPHDGRAHFSGAVYHNLAPVLGPLAGIVGSAVPAEVGGDSRALAQALAAEAKPGLTLVYGDPDRIVVSGASEGGLLSSGLSSLSGFSGLVGVQQSLIEALERESSEQR